MSKEQFSRSKATASKTLYAVMQEMKRRGGSIPVKELYPFIESNVDLDEWEREPAGKNQYIRWTNNFQFYSIDYVKAGYIVKKNGSWFLTEDGEAVLDKGADGVMRLAVKAYHEWAVANSVKEDHNGEGEDEAPDNTNQINLETLESEARDGIKRFLASKNPYEFQEIVAALLRAMGYHTPFVAPRGKDGGVDVIAYVDPLGAQTPRIKVQVKHKPDTAVGASDVRSLLGVLRSGDIALFVTSGTFSSDARNTSTNSREFIRLIDGEDFIDLWQEYYDKMSDEDKNLLPLKRIAFVGE